MFGELVGVVISIFFVAIVLVLSELIRRLGKFSTEFTRKFVHIGVSHWWLVAMFLIGDIRYALIPPVIFVFLNYYSYKKELIKSMERGKDSSDLGTVYFPISLIVIIMLTWNGGFLGEDLKHLGALGVLTMGYGDGFAAIIGENFGRRKYEIFGNRKSLEGSIAMFGFAFLVSAIILGNNISFEFDVFRISFVIAVLAAIIEAITPYGFDNLTVPIFTTLNAYYFVKGSPAFLFIYMACIGFVISFLLPMPLTRKNP